MHNVAKHKVFLRENWAFTLIELLVVIAIVGILAGILIVSMSGATNSANDARRKSDISAINTALLFYGTTHNGLYPLQTTECTLGGGTTPCTTLASELSSLLPSIPTDPASGKYYKYFTNTNGTDFTVYAVLSNGQFALGPTQSCPTDWIDSGYGFCVMKYEAKNVGGVATSQPASTPWVSISQTDAITACNALGNGAHLITNAEWTLLARSAESVSSNWNGTVMYRGHSDGTPANSLASDGTDPYYGTGQSSPSEQRRTLTLVNGQIIWDLAGNAWEWNNFTCQIGSGNGYWYNSGAWIEWNDSNLSDYEKGIAGPSGNYTSANGVGRYYGCTANGNVMLRGGDWSNGTLAGSFTLALNNSPASSGTSVGFRCAR